MRTRRAATLVGTPPAIAVSAGGGERFGKFFVHECLGFGGNAMVHRATLPSGLGIRREVALKRLLPSIACDPAAIHSFVREAKLAAGLEHPNIVRTYELGRWYGTHYITLELVHGRTVEQLAQDASNHGTLLSIDLVLSILIELCDAIEYANTTLGLIHRDISPCNLMVTDDGHLKVIDFGIACSAGRSPTDTTAKGKLKYMADEALESPHDLDTRTDVYSIGVVAWELLAGRPLFERAYEVRRPSEVSSACPRVLDEIVLAALEPSRDSRWQTAGEMRDALEVVRRIRREDRLDAIWPRRRIARGSVPPGVT